MAFRTKMTGTTMDRPSGFGDIMGNIEGEYQAALQANEKRYAQAMAIYDEIISRYSPGGGFGKSALEQLEAQKERDVGKETQAQISSGLFGTTATAGLGTKWEAAVGAPARLKLEDIMMERLSQAQLGKAGFIERREDVYPDVGAAAQYAGQAGAGGGTISAAYGGTQKWGTYGAGTSSGAYGGTAGVGAGGGNIPRVTTPQGPTTAYGGGETGISRTTQQRLSAYGLGTGSSGGLTDAQGKNISQPHIEALNQAISGASPAEKSKWQQRLATYMGQFS